MTGSARKRDSDNKMQNFWEPKGINSKYISNLYESKKFIQDFLYYIDLFFKEDYNNIARLKKLDRIISNFIKFQNDHKVSAGDNWKEAYFKKMDTFNFPFSDNEIDIARVACKVKMLAMVLKISPQNMKKILKWAKQNNNDISSNFLIAV